MQNPVSHRAKTHERGDSRSFVAKLDPELEEKVNIIINRMPSHIKAAVAQKNSEEPKNSLREILQSGPFPRNSPMRADNLVKHSDVLFQPYFQQQEPPIKEVTSQPVIEQKPEPMSYDYKSDVPITIETRRVVSPAPTDDNLASLKAFQEVLDRKVDDALRRSQLITKSPQSVRLRNSGQLQSPPPYFQSPGKSFRSDTDRFKNRFGENLQKSEVKYRGSEYPGQSYQNPYGFLSPQANPVQQHYSASLGLDRYRGGTANSIVRDSPQRTDLDFAFKETLKRSQALENTSGGGRKENTFVSGFLDGIQKNDLYASVVQEKFLGSNGFATKSPGGLQSSLNFDSKPKFVDEKYEDGSAYLGELIAGVRSGRGTFTYVDGSKYEGEWEDGEKNGYGTQHQANGEILYTGEWLRGKYHGMGTLHNEKAFKSNEKFDHTNFSNLNNLWDKYEGEFDHGRWNGLGTIFLTNGEKFVGKFKNGKVHGTGTFYQVGDKEISGEWKENRFASAL